MEAQRPWRVSTTECNQGWADVLCGVGVVADNIGEDTARLIVRAVNAHSALLDTLRATLHFHSGVKWDDAAQMRWKELVGPREATTRSLCDSIRAALALAEQD